jgi:transcriptional regulator with XRE-family HTH domain
MRKIEEEFDYHYFRGRALAEHRESLELTQKTVGEKLSMNPSDLSRIEHGKKALTESTFFELCRLYGVQVSEVTSEAHDKYQAYLREKEPRQDEPVEQLMPAHPFAAQVVEIYDRYVQSRQEKERELFLSILRYIEMLKTAP